MTSRFSFSFSPTQDARIDSQNVHIWLLDQDQLDTQLLADCVHFLSTDEQVRAQSFKRRRLEFIATRTLVRRCLSQYLNISAQKLEFANTEQGKPYLLNAPSNFHFNLSHSDKWVALAISSLGLIGIDVEIERARSFMSIAERYFHLQEMVQLQKASGDKQKQLFFQLWTLKEAFFKALGGGIATGLEKALFDLSVTPMRFSFASELALQTHEWQFFQTAIADNVQLAVASHNAQLEDLSLATDLNIRWFNGADLFR